MSSEVFILPAQPQIPACGSSGTDTKGPAAFGSNPLAQLSDPSKRFSATLNRISERRYGSNQKDTATEKPAATSRGSNTDSAAAQKKVSKTTETPRDHSLGSTMASSLVMLLDLIGHMHPQQQPVEGQQLGIGPFEQLQANISPEATNWSFFERIYHHQDSAGLKGNPAEVFGFSHWMAATAAQGGVLNGQAESFELKGNTPFNPLLQMLGMTGAASDTHPDTISSQDPKIAAGQEGAHLSLNGALLTKLTTSPQTVQTGISENTQMAAAGHLNSQALLEAQAPQMTENPQPLKIQEALKAAGEQPANPNTATEGATVKTPDEVFGIKSAVQKSEMLPVDASGSKISQIDGDSKDSSFLFSQDQMPQHLAKLENGTQASEAAPRDLMSQTLNQIVQKAVLSIHNGQHEVQLHLKPDFLGHIRMQIVNEGQQVAIKMVVEFPFVRDMLENNLHQLKADLQAQGLDIDELEVSVAHDSHAGGEPRQDDEAAKLQAVKNGTDSDGEPSGEPGQTQSRDEDPMAEKAIDYFA